MKNEINQITEEKYWEEMEKTGPENDNLFPTDPDEDEPSIFDRMLEDHFEKTYDNYYEWLQKEAEEEEDRRRFL